MEAFVIGNRVRDPDHGGHLPGSPPAALAPLRVPNSLIPRIVARLLSRWRLGRCRVRVDRDGAPLSLYVVSAADNQGVLVPLRDTRLRAWAVDPCRPFHREVHTSECCIRRGRNWRLTRPLTKPGRGGDPHPCASTPGSPCPRAGGPLQGVGPYGFVTDRNETSSRITRGFPPVARSHTLTVESKLPLTTIGRLSSSPPATAKTWSFGRSTVRRPGHRWPGPTPAPSNPSCR